MEIELKYKIGSVDFDSWKAIVAHYALKDIQEVKMDAVYYDTYRDDFLENGIALRIRSENEKRVATVKTRGSSKNGLHARQEWNKDISEMIDFRFDQWFHSTEIGEKIKDLIGEEPLQEKIKTVFTRNKANLDYADSQFEIAIDRGRILANNLEEKIYELEVELIKGTEKDLQAFGSKLMIKYDLQPENISKYARGLKLLNHIK